jgi:hypothetical protein
MSRLTLLSRPKFKRLVARLDLPRPYVRGLLDTLWDTAHEVGNPVIGTPADVEAAAEWPGEAGLLFAALSELRFLDPVTDVTDETDVTDRNVTPSRWELHDYFDHAPKYAERRRERESERKQLKSCDGCDGEFRSSDPRAKYCSGACRTKAWRDRRGEPVTDVTDGDGARRNVTFCDTTPNSQLPTPNTHTERDITRPSGAPGVTDGARAEAPSPPVEPLPEWLAKTKVPKEVERRILGRAIVLVIEAVTGRKPELARCKTEAQPILSLWRALGHPPLGEFLQDAKKIARAARECGDPLFARDVRAEGWEGGVDRSRSVSTLMVQKKWAERLDIAKAWYRKVWIHEEMDKPHSPVRHGISHLDGRRKWCSRTGDFVPNEEWTPLEPEESQALLRAQVQSAQQQDAGQSPAGAEAVQ